MVFIGSRAGRLARSFSAGGGRFVRGAALAPALGARGAAGSRYTGLGRLARRAAISARSSAWRVSMSCFRSLRAWLISVLEVGSDLVDIGLEFDAGLVDIGLEVGS